MKTGLEAHRGSAGRREQVRKHSAAGEVQPALLRQPPRSHPRGTRVTARAHLRPLGREGRVGSALPKKGTGNPCLSQRAARPPRLPRARRTPRPTPAPRSPSGSWSRGPAPRDHRRGRGSPSCPRPAPARSLRTGDAPARGPRAAPTSRPASLSAAATASPHLGDPAQPAGGPPPRPRPRCQPAIAEAPPSPRARDRGGPSPYAGPRSGRPCPRCRPEFRDGPALPSLPARDGAATPLRRPQTGRPHPCAGLRWGGPATDVGPSFL